MKKIIIFFLIFLFLSTIFSGCMTEEEKPVVSQKTYQEVALDFMTELKEMRFTVAYSYFSDEMKISLSQSQLEQIWGYFIDTYGSFEQIKETHQKRIEEVEVVYLNCSFSYNYLLVFRVVFDEEKQVIGFWQDDVILLTPYTAPAYVDLQNFTDMNITIGTSPWELPATLSIPHGAGPFSIAVLVHGSGPNDKDETIGPNKPFKDIAWGLASKGIAVLRYDKRTYVYPEQLAQEYNLTVKQEVIDDVGSAIAALQVQSYIPISNIYIIGHSLGAMMAPKIAEKNTEIAGLIMLAAPARNLEDLILDQTQYLANLDGEIDENESKHIDFIENEVEKIKALNFTYDETVLNTYKAYWEYLSEYDQVKTAENLTIPLLFLQGKRDYQVTYTEDFLLWNETLHQKDNVEFKTYPLLNHLFIEGQGEPNTDEYMIEGHVDATVINDIINWIKNL